MTKDEVMKEWVRNKVNDNLNSWCYYPLENVKARLKRTRYPENMLHYIVGDVMNTLNDANNIPDNISILRLDTDWYESSKFELVKLYPNVVKGGIIIFDDYLHWDGQRRATDDFFKENNIQFRFLDTGNGSTVTYIKE